MRVFCKFEQSHLKKRRAITMYQAAALLPDVALSSCLQEIISWHRKLSLSEGHKSLRATQPCTQTPSDLCTTVQHMQHLLCCPGIVCLGIHLPSRLPRIISVCVEATACVTRSVRGSSMRRTDSDLFWGTEFGSSDSQSLQYVSRVVKTNISSLHSSKMS